MLSKLYSTRKKCLSDGEANAKQSRRALFSENSEEQMIDFECQNVQCRRKIWLQTKFLACHLYTENDEMGVIFIYSLAWQPSI